MKESTLTKFKGIPVSGVSLSFFLIKEKKAEIAQKKSFLKNEGSIRL